MPETLCLPAGMTRHPEVRCWQCGELRLVYAMVAGGRCGKCAGAEHDARVDRELREQAERRSAEHGVRPRFARWGRAKAEHRCPKRMLGAARARERREREALGFLADVMPVMSAAERVRRNLETGAAWRRRFRADRAADWRRVRAELRALPAHERAIVVLRWNASPVPADPVGLADLIWQMRRRGEIAAGEGGRG